MATWVCLPCVLLEEVPVDLDGGAHVAVVGIEAAGELLGRAAVEQVAAALLKAKRKQ